jgi:hypothetical protein
MSTQGQNKIADTIMSTGYTFQQEQLLHALENQVCTGLLMCNPRVTGFTSFAKAVLNFINDNNERLRLRIIYIRYLVDKGYYEGNLHKYLLVQEIN